VVATAGVIGSCFILVEVKDTTSIREPFAHIHLVFFAYGKAKGASYSVIIDGVGENHLTNP
jgi:hypothetical protein